MQEVVENDASKCVETFCYLFQISLAFIFLNTNRFLKRRFFVNYNFKKAFTVYTFSRGYLRPRAKYNCLLPKKLSCE